MRRRCRGLGFGKHLAGAAAATDSAAAGEVGDGNCDRQRDEKQGQKNDENDDARPRLPLPSLTPLPLLMLPPLHSTAASGPDTYHFDDVGGPTSKSAHTPDMVVGSDCENHLQVEEPAHSEHVEMAEQLFSVGQSDCFIYAIARETMSCGKGHARARCVYRRTSE